MSEASPDIGLQLELFKKMHTIRRFEEEAARAYAQGKIGGFLHLYIGQEAIAVGADAALRRDDYVITTYRDHGLALARGMTARAAMAELFGKVTGCSKGLGGSMHFFDVEHNMLGGYGIVGGHLPVAAGTAFASKYRGEDRVTMAFFGEGAASIGDCHEAMCLASLWKLPMVFVCENNEYSMGTPMKRTFAVEDVTARADGYGLAKDRLFVEDVIEVRDHLAVAIERARKESQPSLVELRTYRFRGHSMSDPGKYRTPEELEERKRKDPLAILRQALDAAGKQREADAIETAIDEEIDDAVRFAEESPEPGPELLEWATYKRSICAMTNGAEPQTSNAPAKSAFVEMRFREAIRTGMIEEMERDERVFIVGEEVGHYQGAYKVTEGMLEKFGPRRVIDAPITESGFTGIAIGAAMVGLRPIVEYMTWNFSAVAFDQILNNAAKIRQMSGGQLNVPIVFRAPNASAKQVGSQHSHAMEHFYTHIPGLKVVAPATCADAKGLIKAAIRDDDPVLVMESETLYGLKGEVPTDPEIIVPIGQARVARSGADATIISWSRIVQVSLEAAAQLAKEGIDCEVIDLRSLRPLDEDAIVTSVRKTHRAVLAYEGWPYGGVGGEIVDRIQRLAFDDLDAPIERVTTRDVPMPYNAKLEQHVVPQAGRIVAAVKKSLYLKGS